MPSTCSKPRRVVEHRAFHHVLFGAGLQPEGENAVIVAGSFRLAFFSDAQPAGRSDSRRIHQIGFFLQALIQNAFDGGVADQFGFRLGNVSRIAHARFLPACLR